MGVATAVDGGGAMGEAFEALLGAAGDGDGGAVHVHFAVADLVEPGPSEGVVAGGDHGGNGEAELVGTAAGRIVLFIN